MVQYYYDDCLEGHERYRRTQGRGWMKAKKVYRRRHRGLRNEHAAK